MEFLQVAGHPVASSKLNDLFPSPHDTDMIRKRMQNSKQNWISTAGAFTSDVCTVLCNRSSKVCLVVLRCRWHMLPNNKLSTKKDLMQKYVSYASWNVLLQEVKKLNGVVYVAKRTCFKTTRS
eukprot:4933200-Amphidinium_carterae.1